MTVVFVHGFASDKHETAGYFNDLSESLCNNYRVVRFDFSGCGKSEGKLEEKDYLIWKDDLDSIINYAKNNYQGKFFILSHSMGCFITALLSPDYIEKTVFTGLPNSNTQYLIDRLIMRFKNRPDGKIDFKGISVLPRSSGVTQKIGPNFWKELKNIKPKEKVEEYSKKTRLLIIHALQDEVLGNKYLEDYSTIPNIIIKHLNGDHSFTKQEDRKVLIQEIKNFLQ